MYRYGHELEHAYGKSNTQCIKIVFRPMDTSFREKLGVTRDTWRFPINYVYRPKNTVCQVIKTVFPKNYVYHWMKKAFQLTVYRMNNHTYRAIDIFGKTLFIEWKTDTINFVGNIVLGKVLLFQQKRNDSFFPSFHLIIKICKLHFFNSNTPQNYDI